MNQSLKSLNSKIIPTPKETPNSHLQTKPKKREKGLWCDLQLETWRQRHILSFRRSLTQMNCCNITKLVTQQKHYIYFVAGQNNIKTLQFHKPSQTQKLFHMQTSKNGEKKDHAIRYQIKILTCSQAKKYLKKKRCYLVIKQKTNMQH